MRFNNNKDLGMEINRTNYEAWIIDWLDGKLSEGEVDMLTSFLDLNPDIKEETDLMSSSTLYPQSQTPLRKDGLKRSVNDLSTQQVELLSIAYFEDDLNDVQKAELQSNIQAVPANKRVFDLIQKSRLSVPEGISFHGKSNLKRLTLSSNLLKVAASVAAAVILTVIVLTYARTAVTSTEPTIATAETVDEETTSFAGREEIEQELLSEYTPKESTFTSNEETKIVIAEEMPTTIQIPQEQEEDEDITAPTPRQEYDPITSVALPPVQSLGFMAHAPSIMPSNTFVPDRYLREEPMFPQFLARVFRSNVLEEHDANDTPIRGYEIAEATVKILNSMWETEMAFIKDTNEAGEVESIYFSSRLFKYQSRPKFYSEEL